MECSNCHHNNPSNQQICENCGLRLNQFKKVLARTDTMKDTRNTLAPGSTLANRYMIIENLGKGGMGIVYRALDKTTQEEIALKLLVSEELVTDKSLERFRNELKLARKIVHQNICRLYDLQEFENIHYITMEYVAGEDLDALIRMTKIINIKTAINIAQQVCEGMAEAHKLEIVHRDLKPKNIIIDKDGNVKILDFGIALSLRDKRLTTTGVLVGTPDYMSPEQEEAKGVDHRSDIYSLGIILYKMVTGIIPSNHRHEIVRNPKEINSDIPNDLGKLILKCLNKDKANRYLSALDVCSELKKIEIGSLTAKARFLSMSPALIFAYPKTNSKSRKDLEFRFKHAKKRINLFGLSRNFFATDDMLHLIRKKSSHIPIILYIMDPDSHSRMDRYRIEPTTATLEEPNRFLRDVAGRYCEIYPKTKRSIAGSTSPGFSIYFFNFPCSFAIEEIDNIYRVMLYGHGKRGTEGPIFIFNDKNPYANYFSSQLRWLEDLATKKRLAPWTKKGIQVKEFNFQGINKRIRDLKEYSLS